MVRMQFANNVFVQIVKYICSDSIIYLLNCCSYFSFSPSLSLSLSPLDGGYQVPICWLGAGCHIFQRTPDFPISSRPDFFEFQKRIYRIFAIYLALIGDPDASLNLSHALMDLISKKCEWINLSYICTCYHHNIIVFVTFLYFKKLSKLTNWEFYLWFQPGI